MKMNEACPTCGGTQFVECTPLADNCTRRICAGCATPAAESLALLRQIAQDLAALRKLQEAAENRALTMPVLVEIRS